MQNTRKGNQTLEEYIRVFEKNFDGLAAIQSPVEDDDKVIYLSQGLGTKYDVLATAMLSKPPFSTYAQFITALQSYDLCLQNTYNEEKAIDQNLAFFSQKSNGKRGRGNGRGGGGNHNFNSKGHGFTPAVQN